MTTSRTRAAGGPIVAGESLMPPLRALTAAERHVVLRIARASIVAAVHGAASPAVAEGLSPALCEPAAAFVSLHHDGQLRGCIGTTAPDWPLHETVARMARSAALDDPRFPPLRDGELVAVSIEVSRLSTLVPARPEQIVSGRHGVSVWRDERRAVFLPQVAAHHHWDRDTLLAELCRKAMLPADAWRYPDTCLMVFTADVFGDSDG